MPTYGTIVIAETQTISNADHNGDYLVRNNATATFSHCAIHGKINFCSGSHIELVATTVDQGVWQVAAGCGDQ